MSSDDLFSFSAVALAFNSMVIWRGSILSISSKASVGAVSMAPEMLSRANF